ncbi:MAG: hypothetical protein ACRDP6_08080 [Actinoallomurus sp.]
MTGYAVLDPAGPVMAFTPAEPGTTRTAIAPPGPRPAQAPAELLADHTGPICVLADDAWADGTAAGARAFECLRRSLEDELRRDVRWAGRSAAAVTGAGAEGVQVVCEAGCDSTTLVRCAVTGRTVVLEAATGDRGRSFLENVRVAIGASPAIDTEILAAIRDGPTLATEVLARARRDPGFRDSLAYRAGDRVLTAGTVLDAFGPVEARLRATVAALVGDRKPARVLLTGPLAALPLFGLALPDGAETVEAGTVLRGAREIAAGRVEVRTPDRPSVTLPVHRISRGRLETETVVLDPAAGPYARLGTRPLVVSLRSRLEVRVDGRSREIAPAGLDPGRYEVGLRPAHATAGTLVLRAEAGDGLLFHPLDDRAEKESSS